MWRSLIVGLVLGLLCALEVTARQMQITVNEGKEIGIDCNPDKNALNLKWQIGGEDIEDIGAPEQKYTFGKSNGTSNGTLTINVVEYTDRNIYTCIITLPLAQSINATTNATSKPYIVIKKEFRLRVRDPLGALWPTIGVIVEAVALFVIIVACDSYTKKSKST